MADDVKSELKLSQMLVMTPQLQLAIRLLGTPRKELPALIADWRTKLPEPIELEELSAGEPDASDATEEERAANDERAPWFPRYESPYLELGEIPDVWIFGDPPQARANGHAYPHYRSTAKDALWIVRSLRQRALTFEKAIGAVLAMRPQLASSMEPASLEPVKIREIAEAIGMHESTVRRVASACRIQTLHGMICLVDKGAKLAFAQL